MSEYMPEYVMAGITQSKVIKAALRIDFRDDAFGEPQYFVSIGAAWGRAGEQHTPYLPWTRVARQPAWRF